MKDKKQAVKPDHQVYVGYQHGKYIIPDEQKQKIEKELKTKHSSKVKK